MDITHETIKQNLDSLTLRQLHQVAEFIDFLKFRDGLSTNRRRLVPQIESGQFAALADFADDDRALAEAGMEDYADLLAQEDL